MTGRNTWPEQDGPAAEPSRLDQFGKQEAEEDAKEMTTPRPEDGGCRPGL